MQRPSLLAIFSCVTLLFGCAQITPQTNSTSTPQLNQTSQNTAPVYIALPAPSAGFIQSVSQAESQTLPESTRNQIAKTLDLIARPNDIWVRIRNGFGIPNIDTPLVTEKQAWFLSHSESLQRTISRSSRYLYHVVEELEKRGMPTELALLPFIESAYNPMAYSSANASGMWQFIPSTGKNYNLKQDWWQDERRDVLASTDAALTYLQAIYEMNGDWHLALASYNWGENAVKRAIEKNQGAGLPTDYLSLRMPEETRNYVPKLQALKNIIANPELYGITLPKIENEPYFAAVNNIQGMDVTTAARLAEMPLEEFKALNPSFNRPVIRGSGDVTLLLPTNRVGIFETNLFNNARPLVTWEAYTPKKGETLSKVANRFGMNLTYLAQINGLGTKSRIKPGTALLVQNYGNTTGNANSQIASLKAMQVPVISYNDQTATKAKTPTHARSTPRMRIATKGKAASKVAVKKSTPVNKKVAGKKSVSKMASEVKKPVS